MKLNAEKIKWRYKYLNEADGPVFKIKNDPRFTNFGKLLAKTGLDELPQLLNVLRGEMSLVGPRPLPVNEALAISKIYQKRHSIKPGITSSWIVNGAHSLSFKKWMEMDLDYVENASLENDIKILLITYKIVLKSTIFNILKIINKG